MAAGLWQTIFVHQMLFLDNSDATLLLLMPKENTAKHWTVIDVIAHSSVSNYDENNIIMLPGAFANNTLYLQTIRLTTSYPPSVHDVHVDLFGFSGDALRPQGSRSPFCSDVPHPFHQTLLGRDVLEDNAITLYCQLDYYYIDHHDHKTELYKNNDKKQIPNLIKMTFLPMASVDYIQTIGSLIWRCNVTEVMNKPQLIQHMSDENKANAALPVHVWIRYNNNKNNTTLDDDAHNRLTKLATFSIPLDTCSLGVGTTTTSTHKARKDGVTAMSYLHRTPVPVGLCVASHGLKPLPYLRQFVQHHLNVGFTSIFIGVKGSETSYELNQTLKLLRRYIEEGFVEVAPYDTPFTCNQVHGTQMEQMQFYQPCLYHYKGLAKYVATWDMDEYWTPPDSLHIDGRHNYTYFQMGSGDNKVAVVLSPKNETDAMKSDWIQNASSWSSFPRLVQNDPLWQQSRYAQSVSITDTLDAIDRYYLEHGCASSFCFHMFPSRVVFVRNSTINDDGSQRTTRIGQDFELRKVDYDNTWQKSIVNTNYAHMAGIHMAGSCLFPKSLDIANISSTTYNRDFHPYSNNEACSPRRFEHHVYGSIHHFVDLLTPFPRWPMGSEPNDNVTQPDEYVSLYATTVELQLDRDERLEESISG